MLLFFLLDLADTSKTKFSLCDITTLAKPRGPARLFKRGGPRLTLYYTSRFTLGNHGTIGFAILLGFRR